MNNLLKNKKTIIICLLLLFIVLVFCYFINNKNFFSKDERQYEERIKKYDANEYIPIYVTESDIANKYLNDFKNLMLSDIEGAFSILNKSYMEKKFGSFEKFRDYIIDEYSVSFYNMNVKEYNVVNLNGYKFYYIRDTRDKLYIFRNYQL